MPWAMLWRLLYEFISGIFNLEFDVTLILQTGFSADILKIEIRYNTKVCFSHLSWLGIGYWLWLLLWFICGEVTWKSWFPSLTVWLWIWEIFGAMGHLCHLFISLWQENEFSLPLQENRIFTSQESWDSLAFCKAVSNPLRKLFPKNFKWGIFKWDHFPSLQPLCFSWISGLRNRKSSLLAFLCAIFFLPCGASLNPC